MAFPTSPINGQIYKNYKWDNGIWIKGGTVYANYRANGSAIPTPGDILNYNSLVEDTHNAVTTGVDWKFTAPESGIYSIDGWAEGTINSSLSEVKEIYFKLKKNGVLIEEHIGGKYTYESGSYTTIGAGGAYNTKVRLEKNDYISVLMYYMSGIFSGTTLPSISNIHITKVAEL